MMYVVTAVHNRYNITKRFIEQLLEQTYKEFVLVLIDDGSTDNTAEMEIYTGAERCTRRINGLRRMLRIMIM